jgi:hypothetical protein
MAKRSWPGNPAKAASALAETIVCPMAEAAAERIPATSSATRIPWNDFISSSPLVFENEAAAERHFEDVGE